MLDEGAIRNFLARVREDPEDTPRLILADWLDEHDDPHQRGSMIRMSCRRDQLHEEDPERLALDVRLDAWLVDHIQDWIGPISDIYIDFERGLLVVGAEAANCRWESFPDKLRQAFHLGWVERFEVKYLDARALGRLPAALFSDWPTSVRGLHIRIEPARSLQESAFTSIAFPSSLSGLDISDPKYTLSLNYTTTSDALAVLARLPQLKHLRLDDIKGRLGQEEARLVTALPELTSLELRTRFDRDFAAAVSTLSGLKRLKFTRFPEAEELTFLERLTALEDLHIPTPSQGPTDEEAFGRRIQAFLTLVAKWQSLRSLSLGGCPLSDEGLSYLSGLNRLRSLTFRGVRFAGDDGLAHLAGLGLLERLEFSMSSPFSGKGLHYLARLPRLRSLSFYSCFPLSSDALAGLSGAAQLERLELRSCDGVTGESLASLEALPRLRSLRVTGGPLGPEAGRHLGALTGLRWLRLGNFRGVDGAFVRELARLHDLQGLQFDWGSHDYPVTDEDAAVLATLSRLELLSIWGAEVTDVGIAALAGLTELRHLDLSRCERLTSACLESLSRLPNLGYLGLLWTFPLTDADLALLARFPRLRVLEIVLPDGVAKYRERSELEELLPHVWIKAHERQPY